MSSPRFQNNVIVFLITLCVLNIGPLVTMAQEKKAESQSYTRVGVGALAERIITGKITTTGESAEAIFVQVQGEKTLTSVDKEGRFSLSVPSNHNVLIIGAKDIEPVALYLSDDNHYDIELQIAPNKAIEHPVKLYGVTIDKQSFNGAFNKVTAEEIATRNNVNITASLDGSVPGLIVGDPNTALYNRNMFLIRGVSSFTASNAPFILLDGMPYSGSLASINPKDIASMYVLKDAASKAVYGARAGNGIIMINTKTGRD